MCEWCAVNCNIFLCDDSDCPANCRVVAGRSQVEISADGGIVYGNVQDANGEDFEIDFTAGQTYYIWTNIGDGVAGHVSDTTMTLFDADGTTMLAQNDDGPVGPVNSYIEFTPAADISAATILVAAKTRQDRGASTQTISTATTCQDTSERLLVFTDLPDAGLADPARPYPPPVYGGHSGPGWRSINPVHRLCGGNLRGVSVAILHPM